MKTCNNRYGKTAIELMLVMVLLLLFSMAALTLVASGSQTYIETVKKSDVQSELRIAQSYFHTKIRQNNVSGAIQIRSFEGINDPCLVIMDTDYQTDYVTVIYVKDGNLYEALISEGAVPTPDISFAICRLDGFSVQDDRGKGIRLRTWLKGDEDEKSLESYIAVKLNH